MFLVRSLFLCPIILLFSMGAMAESLTDRQINGFLSSMPELRSYAERNKLDFNRNQAPQSDRSPFGKGNPFAEGIAQLKSTGHYASASRIVEKHGFSSLEGWADTANRVFRAYMAEKMGNFRPEAMAQMKQALQSIQSNPNLSDEQKRMMMEQMSKSMQSMGDMQDADPADKRAIAPYTDRLEAMMNDSRPKPR